MSVKRGVCKICGCTDRNACYTDEHGACWWMDEQHTICSHCYYGWNKENLKNKNADDEQIEIKEAKYNELHN